MTKLGLQLVWYPDIQFNNELTVIVHIIQFDSIPLKPVSLLDN